MHNADRPKGAKKQCHWWGSGAQTIVGPGRDLSRSTQPFYDLRCAIYAVVNGGAAKVIAVVISHR